jgi:hypothetical protein
MSPKGENSFLSSSSFFFLISWKFVSRSETFMADLMQRELYTGLSAAIDIDLGTT